ncbi:MAG: hypothetical protein H8D34_01165 [Chloroflexi bacterium]|nr:hypothetical protein [Chloroflexota bacterium]MBL7162187.1 hypothetical protein [Anaerolineales bacterium]
MKAVIFHQHGGSEVLQYTNCPTPEPGPGEVLVHLEAAALNRLDCGYGKVGPASNSNILIVQAIVDYYNPNE